MCRFHIESPKKSPGSRESLTWGQRQGDETCRVQREFSLLSFGRRHVAFISIISQYVLSGLPSLYDPASMYAGAMKSLAFSLNVSAFSQKPEWKWSAICCTANLHIYMKNGPALFVFFVQVSSILEIYTLYRYLLGKRFQFLTSERDSDMRKLCGFYSACQILLDAT